MKGICWLIIALVAESCGTRTLTAEQWKGYAFSKDSGLFQKRELKGVLYKAIVKPVQLAFIQEVGDQEFSEENYKLFVNESTSYLMIDYVIQRVEESDAAKSTETEVYSNEFFLISGGDTIGCDLFHREPQIYSHESRISIAFDTSRLKVNDDFKLLFKNRQLGSGEVFMSFTRESIDSAPELNFKTN